jgi:hypothetical protein
MCDIPQPTPPGTHGQRKTLTVATGLTSSNNHGQKSLTVATFLGTSGGEDAIRGFVSPSSATQASN